MKLMGLPQLFVSTKVHSSRRLISPDYLRCMLILVPTFAAIQGKHVPDPASNMGYARIKSQRKYRQYMNRRGELMFAGVAIVSCGLLCLYVLLRTVGNRFLEGQAT